MRAAIERVIAELEEQMQEEEKLQTGSGDSSDWFHLGREMGFNFAISKLKEVLSQHETSPQVRSQADAGDR